MLQMDQLIMSCPFGLIQPSQYIRETEDQKYDILTIKALGHIFFFTHFKIVSRYREPQFQLGKNTYIMCNLNQNICQSRECNAHVLYGFACLKD